MTETTTIEVRKDQAQWLQDIAGESGTYKTAIDSLKDDYSNATTEVVEPSEIVATLRNELSMANEPGVEIDTSAINDRLDTLEGRLKDLQTEVQTLREELQR